MPDTVKDARQMASPASTYGRSGSVTNFNDARTSQPITEGHASPSSGDHGVGQGRNPGLACDHPDLRQSNVSFASVLANLRTVRGNVVDLDVSDQTAGGFSHAGQVALAGFDAANQAGSYDGMSYVGHSPRRPDYHPSQQSATNPNGGHSLGNVESNAVKSSDKLAIMKKALFG